MNSGKTNKKKFYNLSRQERLTRLQSETDLSDSDLAALSGSGWPDG